MRRRIHWSVGFSLVEVTLALGIAAFCLIALFGLLPLGAKTNLNSISQTAAAAMLSSVIADLRATPKTVPTSRQHEITIGTPKVLYFDAEGRAVTVANPTASPRYRLTVTFPSSPAGTFTPTFVTLKISWPALVDPAATTAADFVETFAAFDRN
jgi:uncharacterized protein (TIGR02598 family)